MASEKDDSANYYDPTASQWSDNMAFSREAKNKSQQRQTQQLPPPMPVEAPEHIAHPTGQLTPSQGSRPLGTKDSGDLNTYMVQMNQEIGRVTQVVGGKVEHLNQKVMGRVERLESSVTGFLGGFTGSIQDKMQEILKKVVRNVTYMLRSILNRTLPPASDYTHSPSQEVTYSVQETPYASPPPVPTGPTLLITFSNLIEKRVFFKTIHDQLFIEEKDLAQHVAGDYHKELSLMDRAVREIKNSAPYARKLPGPSKGPFAGMPMFDVLSQVDYASLQRFLLFVNNRPRPFQEKSLRLSEAYATWAHKGAPEN